jgi:hypothetical protein
MIGLLTKRLWKEMDVASFKILGWNFPGWTVDKFKNLSQNIRYILSPFRDFNPGLFEYEAEVPKA